MTATETPPGVFVPTDDYRDSIFWFTPSETDTAVVPAEELNRLAIEQFEDAGGAQ